MGKPISPRKRKYLNGLVDGKTKAQAARDAGYAESVALSAKHHIETPDVRAAFAEIMRERVPAAKIAQRVAEGLDAVETKFFQSEGSVVETRDVVAWSERRQYAALAADLSGYYIPAKAQEVNVNNIIAPIGIEISIVKVAAHGEN